MLVDARSLTPETTLTTQVCIVGAGPAGLTVARELRRQGLSVCMLESGGLDPTRDVWASSAGFATEPLRGLTRLGHRQLGGWANVWAVRLGLGQHGVRYAPLGDVDFQPREGLPHSGWPLSYAELLPYYQRAQRLCGLGPFAYAPEHWESPEAPRLPLTADAFRTGLYQFGSRSVFTSAVRAALEHDPQLTTLLHATAVQLEARANQSSVARVVAAAEPGRRFQVEAHHFVLAAGGVENPRLLLSSALDAKAFGNEYGCVGRYLTEHPVLRTGTLYPASASLVTRAGLYDLRRRRGTHVMGYLALADAALRREHLPGTAFWLFPRTPPRRASALALLEKLLYEPQTLRPPAIRASAGPFLAEWREVVYALVRLLTRGQALVAGDAWGGWSSDPRRASRFDRFDVVQIAEQAPDPENRVELGEQRDPYGRRVASLHWRWSAEDAARARRAAELLAAALTQTGIGDLRLTDGLPLANLSHHLMGTTRMHVSPRHGVVDADCRVFGLENLYLAGSSVFPTGGYANPTLTIIALAARLADHLVRDLQPGVATPERQTVVARGPVHS
jgi:choline dehydrogenase-like flavoprotein